MGFEWIDDLIEQTVIKDFEISIRYDKDTPNTWITFFQSVNNGGTEFIKVSLTAVQKHPYSVFYCCNNSVFNIRFCHLVAIPVTNKKSGFLFIHHIFYITKKAQPQT